MNHLDESTIHAWLDGAVDATQAREIEAHVATCATCAAVVAEARGFVAGASRILGALDDVPSGVIPKRVPSAPATAAPHAPRAKPKRMWRASRWVTGIAALFLGAVVLRTTQTDRELSDDSRRSVVYSADSQAAPAAGMAAAQPEAQPTASIGADRESAVSSAQNAPPKVAAATQPTTRVQKAAAPAEGRIGGGVAAQKSAVAAGGDGGRAANLSMSEQPPSRRDLAPADQRSSGVIAGTRAREEAAPLAAEMTRLRAVPGVDLRADSLTEMDRYTGCYRLADQSAFEAPQAVSALSDAARRTSRAARGAAAPAPAPSTAAQRMDYTRVQVPVLVRLDTTRTSVGYAVRSAASDSVIGTWLPVRDSARVNLVPIGTFVFTRDQKTTCPER